MDESYNRLNQLRNRERTGIEIRRNSSEQKTMSQRDRKYRRKGEQGRE